MTRSLFDELARILATPMPRRRALRTIGATLALGAFRALKPGTAAAAVGSQGECGGGCGPVNKACCVKIKLGYHHGGCCNTLEECCTGSNGETGRAANLMSWCCKKGECGAAGGACACAAGEKACGRMCCKAAQVCYQGSCRLTCPAPSVKCGSDCCTPPQQCQNGKCCDVCGGSRICCDSATTVCCWEPADGPNSPASCCKKATESCCWIGPDTARKPTCCPTTSACVKQLPKGRGGWTTSDPVVCCPPDRQVPDDAGKAIACCYPGQVPLGNKLIVGAGIQGMCCDADRICGSGASLTCCQTGQSCIGGKLCA